MTKTAVFGGGCFWCTEAIFQMLKGVLKVESGYAGGSSDNPTYRKVSEGDDMHAEVIRVTYDPALISYEDLLTVFFGTHDPTTPNRQEYDVGEQYRSIILYQSEEDKTVAERLKKEVQESLKDSSRVVTEIKPLEQFFPAEGYHQDYYKQNKGNRYCELVIEPKIERVQKRFAELVKTQNPSHV